MKTKCLSETLKFLIVMLFSIFTTMWGFVSRAVNKIKSFGSFQLLTIVLVLGTLLLLYMFRLLIHFFFKCNNVSLSLKTNYNMMDSLSVLTSVSNSNKSKNKIFKKSSALTVLKKKKQIYLPESIQTKCFIKYLKTNCFSEALSRNIFNIPYIFLFFYFSSCF